MALGLAIGFVVLVCLLGAYASAGRSVVEYFYSAAFAVLYGDVAAQDAVLAAGMTVSSKLRPRMLLLVALFDQQQQAKLEPMMILLSTQEWTLKDVHAAKLRLKHTDREYSRALSNWQGKANPSVFIQRNPDLRKHLNFISNLTDLVVNPRHRGKN